MEAGNEDAVYELDDTREDEDDEKGVDEFQAGGVESMYTVQRDFKAKEDGEDEASLVSEGVCFAVLDGPAI